MLGSFMAALVAGMPAMALAHPGHGVAVPLHVHGWELAGIWLLAVLVAAAVTLALARGRDDG